MTSLDELTNSNSPSLHELKLGPESDDGDGDTASQRSISLSSPPASTRNSIAVQDQDPGNSEPYGYHYNEPYSSKRDTLDTFSSETDDIMSYRSSLQNDSPNTTHSDYMLDEKHQSLSPPPTYPPRRPSDTESIAESFASGSSRKARPESILLQPPPGKLILGIALVDFNHLVGPRIEWSKGEIFENEEIVKMIPFLALPDGAHLSAEDYSYFHIVPSGPNPTTLFGISCNQQIAASALLVKNPDVTRSTVQKAVVVLASKPVFGPIRDKLGVVTTALFLQRDFSEIQILDDFESGLELSLRTQMTESGLYMGTNLRELVHTFRQRTLVLVKALILQKRIMFYGHPVERLCTYQYSLISLLPGLLQTLDDCGSPPLAVRAPTLSRPTSLRTSDRKSLLAYIGLPLDIFGKDAFFQPYLPLQQLDMLKETKSWLCGSTNSIVTHQKEIDLFVNTETGAFEFRDANLERTAGLTAADRKWMDDIIKDVNESWIEGEEVAPMQGLAFKGSEDYLRVKFEEYITAALAAARYRDFLAKGDGVLMAEPVNTEDFNPLWLSEFKNTNAYEVWERITDPMLFDIVEPRHPCNERVSVVSDIGLRLQEGIQDLKLEQQLAPAREAVSRTFAAGSVGFFKAVEGVKDRWQRSAPNTPVTPSTAIPPKTPGTATPAHPNGKARDISSEEPEIVDKGEFDGNGPLTSPHTSFIGSSFFRRTSVASIDSTRSTASAASSSQSSQSPAPAPTPARLSSWGAGLGSFVSSRFSLSKSPSPGSSASTSPSAAPPASLPLTPPPQASMPSHVLSPMTEESETGSEPVLVEPATPTARHAPALIPSIAPPVPPTETPDPDLVTSSNPDPNPRRVISPIDSLLETLDTQPASSDDHHKAEEEEPATHVLNDSEDESDSEPTYDGMAMAM